MSDSLSSRESSATPSLPAPLAEPIDAVPIINALRESAAEILGSVLLAPLVSFQIGSLGNFPYVWQDPRNLVFNAKTYSWINTNLKANTKPTAQDQVFTNQFLLAFSKITYTLSSADRQVLNRAHADATEQQAALLNAWVSAFGSLPQAEPPLQPIDVIMGTVASDWASPPTTLMDMQEAINLRQLLNKTPASGQTVLPVIATYLNALGAAVPLENAVSMNNGYLARALAALQRPSPQNGGLPLNDGSVRPRFAVSQQQSDIHDGLKSPNKVTIDMTVSRSSSDRYTVSVRGGAGFGFPIFSFFGINLGGGGNYFSEKIATSDNSVTISMSFSGPTLVNYGPTAFDASSNKFWYWMDPVREAIANGNSDVSGFKFSPDPNIDFGVNGPFGLLEGVAISNYPSAKIVCRSANANSIFEEMKSHASASVSFLGIPLAWSATDQYKSKASLDSARSEVTITLDPPPNMIAGNAVDAQGWILGVQTDYPAATN